MPGYYALAVVVGVLAVIATWIFGLPVAADNHLQVWQAFIAWGCHFHSGGGFKGSRTAFVGMTFGAIVGVGSIYLAHHLGSLGAFGAPVAVGLGAFVICLASAFRGWVSFRPASMALPRLPASCCWAAPTARGGTARKARSCPRPSRS